MGLELREAIQHGLEKLPIGFVEVGRRVLIETGAARKCLIHDLRRICATPPSKTMTLYRVGEPLVPMDYEQEGEASVLRLPRQGLRQALCSPLQGISAQAFPQAFPAPGLALHCEEVQSGSGTVTEASVQFKNQKRKVHDNGKTLMNKAAPDIGYVSWLNCLDEDLSFSERVELWRVKSAFRCFINHFEAWEGLKRAMNMDSYEFPPGGGK